MLVGTGVGITGLLGAGSLVSANEHEIPVIIVKVNPVKETIVLENIGNEPADLGGYRMDWEHADDQDQTDAFEQGVTIEAGARLVVWTGFQSTQIPDVDYDHRIADYDQGRINDDNPDVIALLSPGGMVVATSDGEVQPSAPESGEDDGEDNRESEDETGTDNGSEDQEDEPVEDGTEEDEESETEVPNDEGSGEDEDSNEDENAEGEESVPEDSNDHFPHEFEATLSGEAHGIETDASGHAVFTVDTHDGEIDAHYELTVEHVCDVTQAHIHLGEVGEDGPVVAWLHPEEGQEPEHLEGRFDGTLAEGTLTEDNLVGDWDGASMEEAEAALEDEEAYVNVHTEEHPGGEVRGQIEPVNGS